MRDAALLRAPWSLLSLLLLCWAVALIAQGYGGEGAVSIRSTPAGAVPAGDAASLSSGRTRSGPPPDCLPGSEPEQPPCSSQRPQGEEPSSAAPATWGVRWALRPGREDLLEAARNLTDQLGQVSEAEASRAVRHLLAISRRLGPTMGEGLRSRLLALLSELEPRALRVGVGSALAAGGRNAGSEQRLVSQLADPELDGHSHAALCAALAGAAGSDAVPHLLASMRTDRPGRGVHVAQALGGIGGPEAEKALLGVLSMEADSQVRSATERACARMASRTMDARLEEALAEAKPTTAVSLLRVLQERGDCGHGGAVLGVLGRSDDADVQHAGLRALAARADEASVDHLLHVVDSGSPFTRTAEIAIMKLRSPDALDRAAGRWQTLGPYGRRALLHAAAHQPKPSPAILQVAERALGSTDERLHPKARALLARRP